MFSGIRASLRTLLTALIVLFFLMFAAGNHESAHLTLFPLPFEADLPLFLLVLCVFSLGLLFGYYHASSRAYAAKRELKLAQQRSKALQSQLDSILVERSLAASPDATLPSAPLTNVA